VLTEHLERELNVDAAEAVGGVAAVEAGVVERHVADAQVALAVHGAEARPGGRDLLVVLGPADQQRVRALGRARQRERARPLARHQPPLHVLGHGRRCCTCFI